MPKIEDQIVAVRRFNRFYTRIIGLLSEGINQSPFSLVEARIIHEISQRDKTTATDLVRELQIDAGQLSRLVQKLVEKSILSAISSPQDRRRNYLQLTEKGREAYQGLNAVSDSGTASLIQPLTNSARAELVRNMQKIENLLGGDKRKGPLVIRLEKVGELGWLAHQQACLYNTEYGWGADFEALIMSIYQEYALHPSPRKSLWVAEQDGSVVGSVLVLPAEAQENTAQLRLLYVEPSARGQGLGHQLVKQVVDFATEKKYDAITLWTQDCLTAARKTYQKAGFNLIREEKNQSFGTGLNGQYWSLDLKP